MDAVAETAAAPTPPPLRPREELFCRVVARGATQAAPEIAAGSGPERSVTNHDAGGDFSRPAAGPAPAVPPQPAEPSVTNRDVGGVFSPPAVSAAAAADAGHDDPEAFEGILRAVHARPPADQAAQGS